MRIDTTQSVYREHPGLDDDSVVVGIPFAMMEDICSVLKTHYQGWDKFMRG